MGVKYKRTVVPRLVFDYTDLERRIRLYCADKNIPWMKFCCLLGLTYNSLRLKLNGKVPFTTFEIYLLMRTLNIKNKELSSVFLKPLAEE